MATVIRLQRGGRKKRPFYSVVVMDSRKRRDGAFIEKLGYYDPCQQPDVVELDLERVKAWTDLGAQVSPRVASIIRLAEEGPESRAEKAKAAADKKAAAKKAAEDAKAAEEAAARKAAEKAEAEAAKAKAAEEAAEAAAAEEAAPEAEAAEEAAPEADAEEKADA